ncbi:hypothetical protein SAMN02910292_02547 [Lachnospiraceae bacterium XBB2008]|nr:hypothetical protein SAMN02910292_02547 [Lachnospiraceae bacterium XBB2008]
MIIWLKKGFKSIISLLFVCFVLSFAIAGGVVGAAINGAGTALVGLTIGILLGVFFGVIVFGLIATILSIAETQEQILSVLQGGDNKTGTNIGEESVEIENTSIEAVRGKLRDGFQLYNEGTKVYVIKEGGNDNTLYCPHCYSLADSRKDSCPYCKKSFILSGEGK